MSKYVERFQLNGEDAWMQPSSEGDYCEWEPTALIIDAMDDELSDLRTELKTKQALLDAAMEDANRWRQCEAQGLFPEQHLLGERTPLWIYNLGDMNKFMETASEAFDAAMTQQAISQIGE